MRVTLDSNILVYASDKTDKKHAPASLIVRRAARSDCVQTLQSLRECFHVLRRKYGHRIPDCTRVVTEFRVVFRVTPAIESDLDDAIRVITAHGLPYWDAMLWATARRAGCTLILSEDMQDGRELEGVTILNPFNPGNDRILNIALARLDS